MPPYSALSEGRIHSQIRKRSVRRNICPRGYRIGVPVDLGVNSMRTPSDIRTSRVYVKPGVSICNLVSYKCGIRVRAQGGREGYPSPSGSL